MKQGIWSLLGVPAAIFAAFVCLLPLAAPAGAGIPKPYGAYQVLPAIVRGNLAIYPVVGGASHDTSFLMTLDEGIRSGQVTVTEAGGVEGGGPGLVRYGQQMPPRRRSGAEVNRLVLYNNSSCPLLLLAGEIVTGGRQDRVIGSDRIVPANSGPIDLGVFCVEPGRWVETNPKFGSMGGQMAQPSVRTPAMAAKDQHAVWDNVRASNHNMQANLSRSEVAAVDGYTSYAKVFDSAPVQEKIAGYGGAASEHEILRELRARGAVGVVVAVNGRILWADIFASTELLSKYWPKLMRSYVAEAMTSGSSGGGADLQDAQQFIRSLEGGHEVVETEAGVFRRSEITGDGYRVFELTSLLPKEEFDVHITKLRG